MKTANCLPITSLDAKRLYDQGYFIGISKNGYHTSERVHKTQYPADEDFFKQPVEYYLLLSQEEVADLKKFHFKSLGYMVGGFLSLTVALNSLLFLHMTHNLTLLSAVIPGAISYLSAHCFISLHEMAHSADNEYQKLLKKYKLK